MTRTYLEEDMLLIRKYFPGAKTITLRTPFDLTALEDPWALRSDDRDLFTGLVWRSESSWTC